MSTTTEAAITAALANLQAADTIEWFRVDSDSKCTVSRPCEYWGGNPDNGYNDESEAAFNEVSDALKALGLTFREGGFEDNSRGEWWCFTA